MQENDIELWRHKQIVSKVDVNPAMIKQIAFFSLKISQSSFERSPRVLRTWIKSI